MSAYEVRCHSCQVSFPPGTRRCLHCGGKTGAPAPDRPQRRPGLGAPMSLPEEIVDEGIAGAEEAGVPRRGPGPARVMVAAMWVLIAIFASLYRVCSGS